MLRNSLFLSAWYNLKNLFISSSLTPINETTKMTTLREDFDSKMAADSAAIEMAQKDLSILSDQKSALESVGLLDILSAEEPVWFAMVAARYGYAKPEQV